MKFIVRGITPKGVAESQAVDALSAADAQAQVTAQGWMVVDVDQVVRDLTDHQL